MKKETEILTEIKEISPLLADLWGRNVFEVPEGYFNSFSENIQEIILTEKIRSYSSGHSTQQDIPEGYFNTLSSEILRKIKPEEQKEDADDNALNKFLDNQSEKKNVFATPEGYFENLSTKIFDRIAQSEDIDDDEDSTPDFLKEGTKTNVFTVPKDYFEQLPQKILSQLNLETKGRVVPLFRRSVFRYSVAAVLAVLVFLAIFFKVSDFSRNNSFAVVNKHTVPDKAALKYNSEKAFEKGIASLTDDQIIAYLESHGSILDNDQFEKNTNLSGLPDPIEYLENDNTLENYLNKISGGSNSAQKIN